MLSKEITEWNKEHPAAYSPTRTPENYGILTQDGSPSILHHCAAQLENSPGNDTVMTVACRRGGERDAGPGIQSRGASKESNYKHLSAVTR